MSSVSAQEKALVKPAAGASRTIILGTDVIESSVPCIDLGLARIIRNQHAVVSFIFQLR